MKKKGPYEELCDIGEHSSEFRGEIIALVQLMDGLRSYDKEVTTKTTQRQLSNFVKGAEGLGHEARRFIRKQMELEQVSVTGKARLIEFDIVEAMIQYASQQYTPRDRQTGKPFLKVIGVLAARAYAHYRGPPDAKLTGLFAELLENFAFDGQIGDIGGNEWARIVIDHIKTMPDWMLMVSVPTETLKQLNRFVEGNDQRDELFKKLKGK